MTTKLISLTNEPNELCGGRPRRLWDDADMEMFAGMSPKERAAYWDSIVPKTVPRVGIPVLFGTGGDIKDLNKVKSLFYSATTKTTI